MPALATPGVSFELVDPAQTALGPVRTDIAGFAGYAERGPLHTPLRLTSERQFETEFGDPLAFGYLSEAVHAFFANGGAVCHVVRAAHSGDCVPAQLALPAPDGTLRWTLQAASRGSWGNGLSASVRTISLGATRTRPGADPQPVRTRTPVAGLAGLETGSLVRLRQAGHEALATVARVDALHTRLEWTAPLPAEFDLGKAIDLETVELSLVIRAADRVVERFDGLTVVPAHRRYAPDVLAAESLSVRLLPDGAPAAPFDAWLPAPADGALLGGGRDGLQDVELADLVGDPGDVIPRGMAALDAVAEVSVLACPDLMARPVQPPRSRSAPRPVVRDECLIGAPPQSGRVSGGVVDATTGEPLEDVLAATDDDHVQLTDAGGAFALDDVQAGSATLTLTKERYVERVVPLSVPVGGVVEAGEADAAGILRLVALEQPPAWSEEELVDGQGRLIDACEHLRDRVVILDTPPATEAGGVFGLDEVATWRARLDSAFSALYFPWILVTATSGGARQLPPSGHVAGVYARTDLRDGVHRAPANEPLVGVIDVALPLDDVQHGALNDADINALRPLPGRGTLILGARTLSSDEQWRFVNVRRLISAIEVGLLRDTQWVVFESHTAALRRTVTLSVSAMLEALWRRGALAGDTAEAGFQVVADETDNPPAVIDAGELLCTIGLAPTRPFEFIVVRLGRTDAGVEVAE